MNFDHLQDLDVNQSSTIKVYFPEIGPDCWVEIRPANQSNRLYYNAMLSRSGDRMKRMARSSKITAEDLDLARQDDRELYPLYVMVGWNQMPADRQGNLATFSRQEAKDFCKQLPDWLFDRMRDAAGANERFLPEGMEEPDVEDVLPN